MQRACLNVSPRWLYAQFIAVDANFKLRLKNRKINDPELGPGWSYFVEDSAYTHHVANKQYDKEVSRVPNVGESILTSVPGHELWY